MDEHAYTREHHTRGEIFPNLPLLNCFPTVVEFGDTVFETMYCRDEIKVSLDEENVAVITLKNQRVPIEDAIADDFALSIKKSGNIDYQSYFDIKWPDELSVPELVFYREPSQIHRHYEKGQWIELGIEPVSGYDVAYQDGVGARFFQSVPGFWEFHFSTGFHGSFKKEEDDSYVIRFKGSRLEHGEEEINSQSKFIITRSKYTNHLLLILQENAEVTLRH